MSANFTGLSFPNTQSLAIPGPITATKNRAVLFGMAWVKLTALPTLDDYDFLVYSDGTDTISRMRFKLKTFLGDGGFLSVGGTAPDATTPLFRTATTNPIEPGRWTHVAGAVDYTNSLAFLYIDGDLIDSGPVDGTFGAATTSNTDSPRGAIGALSGGDSEGCNGEIEDVRLYSAHSPAAVKTIAALRGKDSVVANLLHKFPLKDLPSGVITAAVNVADFERIEAVAGRSPTWSDETITSRQKLPPRSNVR